MIIQKKLAKLQKINLDMTNLEEEEKRIKKLTTKLENSLNPIGKIILFSIQAVLT